MSDTSQKERHVVVDRQMGRQTPDITERRDTGMQTQCMGGGWVGGGTRQTNGQTDKRSSLRQSHTEIQRKKGKAPTRKLYFTRTVV